MSYVFVSHASPDKPRIKPIVEALREAGLKVWIDNPVTTGFTADEIDQFHRIRAGRRWEDEIDEAKKEAACILVCWSKHVLDGKDRITWLEEAGYARAEGKLVACTIDDVSPADLPGTLSEQQLPCLDRDMPAERWRAVMRTVVDDIRTKMELHLRKRLAQAQEVVAKHNVGRRNFVASGNVVIEFFATRAYPKYADGLTDLATHYLGDQAHPKAFGGRDDALRRLDQWLDDKGGPANLLLAGPAARGKTALLVRWLESVANRCTVVFVPISIRFGTNAPDAFYTILATKLENAFGADLDNPGDASSSFEDRCLDILNQIAVTQKPLLIAIDGLDEATGWEIHRGILRSRQGRIRFIVSARAGENAAGQWLDRVRWRSGDAEIIELDRLDRAGVEQILAKSNLTSAASDDDVDIAGELLRLSEGDPLLLEYYIQDISDQIRRTGKIDAAAIEGATAGFGAYFAEWLREQKPLWETDGHDLSPLIEAILALLACAMGPLRKRDLEALLDTAHQIRGGFSAVRLEKLSRFVLESSEGYVLAHPRLSEHLRSPKVFDGQMIDRSIDGFLAWGNTTLHAVDSGAVAPRDVPPYLLQFLVQHMASSPCAASDFTQFYGAGWMRAWEASEGGYRGYSGNLIFAAAQIKRRASPDVPWRSWVLEAELLLNSIRNAAEIPSDLLFACVKKGVITPRQGLLRLELMSAEQRACGLVSMLDNVDENERGFYLADAQQWAGNVRDMDGRVRALSAVARVLGDDPQRPVIELRLLAAVRESGNMAEWLRRMEHVAPAVTGPRLSALLSDGFRQVTEESRWHYLGAILPFLPTGMLDRAITDGIDLQQQLSSGIKEDGRLHGAALAVFFPYLPSREQGEQCAELLGVARSLRSGWDRAQVLATAYRAVPDTARAGIEAEMFTAAQVADGTFHGRINCLAMVAGLIAEPLRQRAVEEATELALRDISRLAPIAPLVDGALLERCFSAAMGASNPSARAQALSELAPRLNVEQLRQALVALPRIPDKIFFDLPEAALLVHLSVDDARPALKRISESVVGARPLIVSFPAQLRQRLFPELEKTDAEGISALPAIDRSRLLHKALKMEDQERDQQLVLLAPHLHGTEAVRAFAALTNSEISEPDKTLSANAVSLLLPQLPEATKKFGIDFVLDTIGTTYFPAQLHIVCNVARLLSAVDRDEVLRHARAMAREEKYRGAIEFGSLFEFVEGDERAELLQDILERSSPTELVTGISQLYRFLNNLERRRITDVFIETLKSADAPLSLLGYGERLPPELNIAVLDHIGELMSRSPRLNALLAVARLAETIAEVEGPQGVSRALRGLRTVAEWFP